MSHTPGPWVGTANQGVEAKDGTVFETGCGCCTSSTLAEDDARLIAAAPELLFAIRALLIEAEEALPFTTDGVGLARAAIAKATGESNA